MRTTIFSGVITPKMKTDFQFFSEVDLPVLSSGKPSFLKENILFKLLNQNIKSNNI
jgi:hypothetical protein